MTHLKHEASPWYALFSYVHEARTSAPRGQRTKELLACPFILHTPREQRWCTFPSRKLNIGYTCFEFIWYLIASNEDTSITERAAIWKHLAERGVLQSNYGQYIFREKQFQRVVDELKIDKDSRRAVITILRNEHFYTNSDDIPCTLGLTFQIRQEQLHMHATMRSSDIVFGMGSDVPCFTWTQELMLNILRRKYPNLRMGGYFHTSHSMHAYEKHFGMLQNICEIPEHPDHVDEPPISGHEEALWVIHNPYVLRDQTLLIPEEYRWARWLSLQANGVSL